MAEQTPKKGGGKTVVILLLVMLLLGGAGGGAWWWATRANAASAGDEGDQHASPDEESPKKKAKKKKRLGGASVPLQPFLVNLADPGASHFLRCTLALVVEDEEAAAELAGEEHGKSETIQMSRLRSAILELLTTQTADVLVTSEGKQKLKEQIVEKANELLPDIEVLDVLFSDFVVQF